MHSIRMPSNSQQKEIMTSRQLTSSKTRLVCRFSTLILCQFLVLGGLVSAQDAAKLERLIKLDDAEGVRKVIQSGPASLIKANLPMSKLAPLYFAIQNKKVESAKVLIDLDAPLVSVNRRKQSALHLAISRHESEIIKTIIEKADDVDYRDNGRATPLMYSVMYSDDNSIGLIDLLLAKGADVEATNANRQTALYLACHYNRKEIAKHLLNLGAKVSVIDKQGLTPFLAACSRDVSLVELLLDNGADPLMRNLRGDTALHLACGSYKPKITARIHQYFNDVDVLNGQFQTPLLMSVMNGNMASVKLLIERGADLQRYDSTRANPQTSSQTFLPLMHFPATQGQTKMLKLLIESGASINGKDSSGNTPLHASVNAGANNAKSEPISFDGKNNQTQSNRFLTNIELLVAAQANLTAKNKDGETAVQLAAQQDYFAAVEMLVDGSETLDFEVGNGRLIHWAAKNRLVKTMNRLLEKDRTPEEDLDELKRSPLHYAAGNGSMLIVEMLIKQGFDTDAKDIDGATPLMMAAAGNHADVVQTLLVSGVHLDTDSSGQTAVHLAAWSGASEVIEVLSRTTDVDNLKTATGYTPQHAAAWQGHAKVVGQLVLAGADPNAADSDGWTPLHKAAFRGHAEVVKVLLEKGADKDLKTAAGSTAFSMAEGNKKKDIADLLR